MKNRNEDTKTNTILLLATLVITVMAYCDEMSLIVDEFTIYEDETDKKNREAGQPDELED